MPYTKQYKEIFNYTAALLAEGIHEEVAFIDKKKGEGLSVSWFYIKIVADNITAYNELFPYSHFVHSSSFLSY